VKGIYLMPPPFKNFPSVIKDIPDIFIFNANHGNTRNFECPPLRIGFANPDQQGNHIKLKKHAISMFFLAIEKYIFRTR